MRPDGNLPLRGYKTSIWEGGFREPGIAWWPGRIPAGSASDALVATYDIFPTVINLAGAAGVLPSELVLDGIDLAPILFDHHHNGHRCIMFYHEPHSASDAANLTSLAAIRCGDYKVHTSPGRCAVSLLCHLPDFVAVYPRARAQVYWFIDGTSSTPLPDGVNMGVRTLDDPIIFDLSKDWSEAHPLAANGSEWAAAKQLAEAARLDHLKTLVPVLNQMDLGSAHEYAICGAPNSQAKYPHLPNCTKNPEHWKPPVCLVGGTIDQCIGQTLCQPGCKFVNCSDHTVSEAAQRPAALSSALSPSVDVAR